MTASPGSHDERPESTEPGSTEPGSTEPGSTEPDAIVPEPTAFKRAGVAPLRPTRVLEGFRSLFQAGPAMAPADECAATRPGTGVERPGGSAFGDASHIERTFAFVDVCGFTAYLDGHGTHAAIDVLRRFRAVTREVAARRGVRVAKWLGDGVMLVGASAGPTVAAVAELVARFDASGIDIHVGVAEGPVLLFEGDDYIGRPVNLASRLCDAAAPGELLALVDAAQLPEWIQVRDRVTVHVVGVGDVERVSQLGVVPDVLEQLGRGTAA